MKLFSGSSNTQLAQRIGEALQTSSYPLKITVFPDGEQKVQVTENVVEEHCIIVLPTNPPVDQNYMQLFFAIDALKRSGASQVTVVVPYLGYQRQDHVFLDGEGVSIEAIATMFQSLKLDHLIVVDLHTPKINEFFTTTQIHDVSALPLFAEKIKEQGFFNKTSILVSPDMGGIRRIKILSEILDNMPFVTITKDRDLHTGNINDSSLEWVTNGREKSEFTTAIIVDDMASSGKTLVKAADLMHEQEVSESIAFITHPVFAKEAPELLQNSRLKKVYATDSIFVPEEKRFEKLEVLSIAGEIEKRLREFSSPLVGED